MSGGKVLVATLGSEPQVVTLTRHLLEAQGETVEEIRVLHTDARLEPAAGSVRVLREAVEPSRLRLVPILDRGMPIADVVSEADTRAVFAALYREILDLKEKGRRLHFSVAGGRKPMAIYGMVVAQLLFDSDDRLWHLISTGSVLEEKRLRPRPGDEVSLVAVPVARWSTVSPVWTDIARLLDPWEAWHRQEEIQRRQSFARRREFFECRLTPAEQEVAEALMDGLDNAAIARHLYKSEKTVANQLSSIYGKMHEFLNFREDRRIDRSLVIAELAPYFTLRDGRK